MRQYTLRRLMFFVPVLLVTSAITFFAVNLIPGDLAQIFLGFDADQEDLEAFREAAGLNKPIAQRYVEWLGGFLTGDPGKSLLGGVSIQGELQARFPVTLTLMFFGFVFTMFFGVLFGTLAALYQDRGIDYFVRTASIFGSSIPDFFALTLLILVPAVLWRYAPPFGYVPIWEEPWRSLKQVVPPTLVLSIGGGATLMRIQRSALLEVLRQDYIRTARAKGLSEMTVLFRHAMKNAMIPVLTIGGGLMAGLLSGTIILERITSLPGIGAYIFNAVLNRDFNVIMTMTMYFALLVMITNLIVDLLYAWVDPRIRYQ
jgi:peptide/nickel transport system permease protein